MTALNDLQTAVTRLSATVDAIVAGWPTGNDAELEVLAGAINAASDNLLALLPPPPPGVTVQTITVPVAPPPPAPVVDLAPVAPVETLMEKRAKAIGE